jgi:adenosine deaminase
VRFAPQLHASIVPEDNFNIEQVIRAVDKGLHRAMSEYNTALLERKETVTSCDNIQEAPYEYGIIVSAMRLFTPEMGRYYSALCAMHSHLTHERVASLASEMLVRVAQDCRMNGVPRIVALDIAGAENGFKNSTHSVAFDLAHGYFLKKTVHAGEGFGPESIFQAVRDLHADRIGHGFHLFRYSTVSQSKHLCYPVSVSVYHSLMQLSCVCVCVCVVVPTWFVARATLLIRKDILKD